MIRFLRRFTVLGLAILLTSGVWCRGLEGDASAILVGKCPGLAPGCAQSSTSLENAGCQNSVFPCAFGSLDLLSQGASPSVQTDDFFHHGHFVPTVPSSSAEEIALVIHLGAAPQNSAGKISPHLFYSVLNL